LISKATARLLVDVRWVNQLSGHWWIVGDLVNGNNNRACIVLDTTVALADWLHAPLPPLPPPPLAVPDGLGFKLCRLLLLLILFPLCPLILLFMLFLGPLIMLLLLVMNLYVGKFLF
jgi:hypothetical protein